MLFSCISASYIRYIGPNWWVFTALQRCPGLILAFCGHNCLLWPHLRDLIVLGVGQTQPKICGRGEAVLSHSNIEEGNLLVWPVFMAACMLLALWESRCILIFLSNKSYGEKHGCFHAASPVSSQRFHTELPVAPGTGEAACSPWEDDSLGVMSAKGTSALEKCISSKP